MDVRSVKGLRGDQRGLSHVGIRSKYNPGVTNGSAWRFARRCSGKAALLVLLACALVLLRLIWGIIAESRLNGQLRAARPDPITPSELFAGDRYDDPRNAVPLIEQAVQAASALERSGKESPSQSNFEFPPAPPYPAKWHQLANASVAASSSTFQLVRKAREKPVVAWPTPQAKPLLKRAMTGLSPARSLANLLGDAAIHAHVQGDDLAALDRIDDTLYLARAIDQQSWLIGHLVSIGIESIATTRLEVIAPALRIGAVESDPVRQRVRRLIDQLGDDRELKSGLRRALVAERVLQIDTVDWITQDIWVCKPMYKLDLARVLAIDHVLISAATQPTLPAAEAILSAYEFRKAAVPLSAFGLGPSERPRDPPDFTRQMSSLLSGALDRVVEANMRARLERTFARIALAMQLYRSDHHGALPGSIAELVPRYLLSVPTDPYAKDGQIIYRVVKNGLPDGSDRPLLFSVGPDGLHNPAMDAQYRTGPAYDWTFRIKTEPDDQFRDLTRWQAPPATQPAIDTGEPDERPETDDAQ